MVSLNMNKFMVLYVFSNIACKYIIAST